MSISVADFCQWLADFQFLAVALLAVVLAATALMRQPARRMAIYKALLAALVALAVLCALPGWSVIHLISDKTPQPAVRKIVAVQPPRPSVVQPIPHLDVDRMVAAEPAPFERSRPGLVQLQPARREFSWAAFIRVYLAGSALAALWLAAGAFQARRLREASVNAPTALQHLLKQIVGAAAPPELLVSARVQTPVALGLVRPAIILPEAMVCSTGANAPPSLELGSQGNPASGLGAAWLVRELTPILAHEWAHLENRDLHTLAASRLLLVLLWPQPLYWLLRRKLRLDQETLADAAASELTGRLTYAEQLLVWARELPRVCGSRLEAAVGLWEGPSQLKRRIAILLNERFAVMRLCSRRWRIGSAGAALVAAFGLSLVTLQSGAPTAAATHASSRSAENTQATGAKQGKAAPDATKASNQSSPEVRERMRAAYERLQQTKLAPNTIVGMCLDEEGRPSAGADVSLYHCIVGVVDREAKLIMTAKADVEGRFRFVDVVDAAKVFPEGVPDPEFATRPQPLFGVLVSAPGNAFVAQVEMATQVLRDGAKKLLVLRPAATLIGVVTGPDGRPVAGAKVMAGYDILPGSDLNSAQTDGAGRYAIERLAPWNADEQRKWFDAEMKRQKQAGSDAQFLALSASGGPPQFPLTVRHPDFAVKMASVEQIPGEANVQLAPGAVIEGQVLYQEDGQSRPTANVTVRVTREPRDVDDNPTEAEGEATATIRTIQQETARTDAEGRYRVPSLPPGRYSITAVSDGWVSSGLQGVAVERGETVAAPELVLTRGVVVRVQLVAAETGEPLKLEDGQRGYVHPVRLPRQRFSMPVIDNNVVRFSASGRGEIRVPPGRYTFAASVPTGDQEQPFWMTAVPDNIGEANGQTVAEGETPTVTVQMGKQAPPRVGPAPGGYAPQSNVPPKNGENDAQGNATSSAKPAASIDFKPVVPPADQGAGATSSENAAPPPRPPKRVRLVVDNGGVLTFEGQPTTVAELPGLLRKAPDRARTILEIAIASDQMTVRQSNDAQAMGSELARKYGFWHSSYIGVHPLGTKAGSENDVLESVR